MIDVPVSDEDLTQIYLKMAEDDRCFTYVAEADDQIVGLVTGVCVPAFLFQTDISNIKEHAQLLNRRSGRE